MDENFTITEKLIQYLDNELDEQERMQLEQKIAAEPGIKEEFDNLRIAQRAVNNYGTQQKVAAIHREMMDEIKTAPAIVKKPAVLKTFMYYGSRIAAAVLILLFSVTVYQYITLSPQKLFNQTNSLYQLQQTRGGEENNEMETAYQQNNFTRVTEIFEKQTTPSVPAYFIAGESYLQKENAESAIRCFLLLRQKNKEQQSHLFEEESTYYLALAYILHNEPGSALPLFEEIFNNKAHAYHDKVSKWTLLKTRWLIQKG